MCQGLLAYRATGAEVGPVALSGPTSEDLWESEEGRGGIDCAVRSVGFGRAKTEGGIAGQNYIG